MIIYKHFANKNDVVWEQTAKNNEMVFCSAMRIFNFLCAIVLGRSVLFQL